MGKLFLLLSFVSLMFVGIGTIISPNDPMFWLTSSAMGYEQVRAVLAALILGQLNSRPPRHLWFRVLAGTVAVLVGGWALQQTYTYHMQVLDTFAFIGASMAIFVTALEPKTRPAVRTA